ncbi:MAG: hypothetical protein MI924_21535, partial [Chloroflexales bacterium]|nr:hypothetical protein [Chloroflexales bacterium]
LSECLGCVADGGVALAHPVRGDAVLAPGTPFRGVALEERQQVGSPWGPHNPQALNRYSYVLNNPLRWTDPSGHYYNGDSKFLLGTAMNKSVLMPQASM